METANKKALAEICNLTVKEVESVFDSIMGMVTSGKCVKISGFGKFSAKLRKGRKGYNPQSGEQIDIKQVWTPRFKPGLEFKKRVKKS